jgi:hypothetical protein
MSTNQAIQRPENREDEYRVGRGAVRLLTIPGYRFFMVDGSGPPGEGAVESRMPGLYRAAYGLRFAIKRRGAVTKVGPLEGLWWHAEDARNLDEILAGDRAAWRWTLMIVVPDEATEAEIQDISQARGQRSRRRSPRRCGSSNSRRETRRRSCTSVRTRRNVSRLNGCTRTLRQQASTQEEGTTSSTSGIPSGALRNDSARSSASRSNANRDARVALLCARRRSRAPAARNRPLQLGGMCVQNRCFVDDDDTGYGSAPSGSAR